MIRVEHGDCLDVLRRLAAEGVAVHAVVTDPPYHLTSVAKRWHATEAAREGYAARVNSPHTRASRGFMGQAWDGGDVAFRPDTWRLVFAVMKPGAHLLAFAGTRTYHRMVCAVEDAGFEIRDQIGWLYGSGFPKSHDVSKGIDRAAGAEREVIATGDPVKRMIAGADQDRTGSWIKDNGRVRIPTETKPATDKAQQWEGWGTALKPAWEPIVLARRPLDGTVAANCLKHGCGALNIDGCRVNPGELVPGGGNGQANHGGQWAGEYRGERPIVEAHTAGRWPANVIHDGSPDVLASFPEASGAQRPVTGAEPSDSTRGVYGQYAQRVANPHADAPGTAARFFYSAKADDADRLGSKHPTVKPVDLMAYLCRLVTPPKGLVLDPFAGTGTTGAACMREGFDAILIEREAAYVADIHRRVAHASGADAPLFGATP